MGWISAASAQEDGTQASDDEVARARAIFKEGLALSDRGRWAEAEERFRQVLAVKSAPPVLFNLATVLVEQGKYAESGEIIDGLLADADTPNNIKISCQELLTRMNNTGGKLAVELSGAAQGATIAIDGAALPVSRARQAHWLKAGKHRVEVHRTGAPPVVQDVSIDAGVRRVLQIHLVPTTEEAARLAVAAPPGNAAATSTSSPTLLQDWRFWAVTGGAVAATVVVIVIVAAATGAPFSGNFEPGRLTFP